MEGLIVTGVYILIGCVIVYGIFYALERSKMPTPVYWVVGGIIIIVLLFALAHFLGGGPAFPQLPR
jgi:hypothetical protein